MEGIRKGAVVIEAILAGIFGLLIGSFLNVCIYRLPRDLSVVRPRSFCPLCESPISWYDNIPLFSYFALGGKCRSCKARIGWRYPVVEALTGLMFFAAVWSAGWSLQALKLGIFSAILIELIFSDLEERILPDELTLGGIAAGLLFAVAAPISGGFSLFFPGANPSWWPSLAESAAGTVVTAGALWLVGKLYRLARKRDGLGLGDIKMVAMIGAFLGLQGALLTLILGSLMGSAVGLLYLWMAKKDARTYPLPLGTFLGIGAFGIAFFKDPVLSWYLQLGAKL